MKLFPDKKTVTPDGVTIFFCLCGARGVCVCRCCAYQYGEPPAAMMAVYEHLHNKQIEKVGKAKN